MTLLRILFLAVILSMPVAVYAQDSTVNPVGEDDLAVKAAMEEARSSLNVFWALKAKNDPAYTNFSLKVALKTVNGSVEHIWIANAEQHEGMIRGIFANDPINLGDFKIGDGISFPASNVSDWQYVKNQKLYGHYTTRVLVSRLPPEQAAQYLLMLGENP